MTYGIDPTPSPEPAPTQTKPLPLPTPATETPPRPKRKNRFDKDVAIPNGNVGQDYTRDNKRHAKMKGASNRGNSTDKSHAKIMRWLWIIGSGIVLSLSAGIGSVLLSRAQYIDDTKYVPLDGYIIGKFDRGSVLEARLINNEIKFFALYGFASKYNDEGQMIFKSQEKEISPDKAWPVVESNWHRLENAYIERPLKPASNFNEHEVNHFRTFGRLRNEHGAHQKEAEEKKDPKPQSRLPDAILRQTFAREYTRV